MSDLSEALEAVSRVGDDESKVAGLMASPQQLLEIYNAARLVASGELIPRTDRKDVKWCVVHESARGAYFIGRPGCDAGEYLNKVSDCSIVDAGLLLPGDET